MHDHPLFATQLASLNTLLHTTTASRAHHTPSCARSLDNLPQAHLVRARRVVNDAS